MNTVVSWLFDRPPPIKALRNILIVGASLAGLCAAETLRSTGFDGQLTLRAAEPEMPYDRPPLSKELLRGETSPHDIALRIRAANSG